MTRHVFISHSATDRAAADAIRAALEAAGSSCWIAPRDIPPGAEWAAAIMAGIAEVRVLLLVHSAASAASQMVLREVNVAVDSRRPVIPVRIDATPVQDSMQFYLGSTHWLDAASAPLATHLVRIVAVVGERLGPTAAPPPQPATLDGPVSLLTRRLRPDPIALRVDGDAERAPEGLGRGSADTPHWRVEVTRERLRDDLGRLLDAAGRAIVFVRTRHAADRWAGWITDAGRDAVALHGAMTTAARRAAIDAMRLGDASVLVATDLASRGLDLAAVSLVVHLERSDDEIDYVHRSGRTGRAGLPGVVVNLLRNDQWRAAMAMEARLGVVGEDASLDQVLDHLGAVTAELRITRPLTPWHPPLGRRSSAVP